ncbi:hypothetical protein N9B69_00355 [Amylibacter sp.]|nr:hypothetical protein [Amylibacter sp.]
MRPIGLSKIGSYCAGVGVCLGVVLAGLGAQAQSVDGPRYTINGLTYESRDIEWQDVKQGRKLLIDLHVVSGDGNVRFDEERWQQACDVIIKDLPLNGTEVVAATDIDLLSLRAMINGKSLLPTWVRIDVVDGVCTSKVLMDTPTAEDPKVGAYSKEDEVGFNTKLFGWTMVRNEATNLPGNVGIRIFFEKIGLSDVQLAEFPFDSACGLFLNYLPETMDSAIGFIDFLNADYIEVDARIDADSSKSRLQRFGIEQRKCKFVKEIPQ